MSKSKDRKAEAVKNMRKLTRRMATHPSDTDPLGSYTGVPKKGERPVQDADDL